MTCTYDFVKFCLITFLNVDFNFKTINITINLFVSQFTESLCRMAEEPIIREDEIEPFVQYQDIQEKEEDKEEEEILFDESVFNSLTGIIKQM